MELRVGPEYSTLGPADTRGTARAQVLAGKTPQAAVAALGDNVFS
jgi:hypothetical protein